MALGVKSMVKFVGHKEHAVSQAERKVENLAVHFWAGRAQSAFSWMAARLSICSVRGICG
jgi:hypothetical protein